MFITLVWNDQQSFNLHNIRIIILPILFFLYVKFQSIVSLLSYSTIPYGIKLYTILHIKSLQLNFEVIVNVNRLYYNNYIAKIKDY